MSNSKQEHKELNVYNLLILHEDKTLVFARRPKIAHERYDQQTGSFYNESHLQELSQDDKDMRDTFKQNYPNGIAFITKDFRHLGYYEVMFLSSKDITLKKAKAICARVCNSNIFIKYSDWSNIPITKTSKPKVYSKEI